jgi:hypothetical protein
MQDDGEGFAVGDDDPRNTTYTFDAALLTKFLRERLASVRTNPNDPFEPRIFADRVVSRLSPTRTGDVSMDKVEVHERVQLVLEEIEEAFLRARVAREVLQLLQLLTDVNREDDD